MWGIAFDATSVCKTGMRQSPIDFPASDAKVKTAKGGIVAKEAYFASVWSGAMAETWKVKNTGHGII